MHLADSSMPELFSKIERKQITFDVISKDESTEVNLNRLNPSFMYSQILKDILLQFDDRSEAKKELVSFYRQKYADFPPELKLINEFETTYEDKTSVEWYTREKFVYSILNKALRLNDIQTLYTTRLLLRDIHQQLEEMHRNMTSNSIPKKLFRGQGISNEEYKKLRNNIGGLISFNSFLSTSICRNLPEILADCRNSNTTGILFEIETDSSVRSSPFASLDNVSQFGEAEKEFLFSMHTIFRIVDIVDEERIPLVRLKFTADDDLQLQQLKAYIHKNSQEGTPRQRLIVLMYQMGKYDLAAEFLQKSLLQARGNNQIIEVGLIIHYLGQIIAGMGRYDQSIIYYQKAIKILQLYIPKHHPEQIKIIFNLATTYQQQGNYDEALRIYKNAHELLQQSQNPSFEDLFGVYVHIGAIQREQGKLTEALQSYQKADEIHREHLPSNHPRVATLYSHLALVCYDQNNLNSALEYVNRCIKIQENSLPDLHGDRALPLVNKGLIFYKQGEIQNAICQFEKAIDIQMRCLHPDHPDIAFAYSNLGTCYRNLGKTETAIEYHKKCLDIQQKNLPPEHPNIAITYNNLGETLSAQKPDEALTAFHKAVSILSKCLTSDRSDLALVYSNIGNTYLIKNDYAQANKYLEKSLNIRLEILLPDDPLVASVYYDMVESLWCTKQYRKAYEYAKKAVEICRRSLPPNDLQRCNAEKTFETMSKQNILT